MKIILEMHSAKGQRLNVTREQTLPKGTLVLVEGGIWVKTDGHTVRPVLGWDNEKAMELLSPVATTSPAVAVALDLEKAGIPATCLQDRLGNWNVAAVVPPLKIYSAVNKPQLDYNFFSKKWEITYSDLSKPATCSNEIPVSEWQSALAEYYQRAAEQQAKILAQEEANKHIPKKPDYHSKYDDCIGSGVW